MRGNLAVLLVGAAVCALLFWVFKAGDSGSMRQRSKVVVKAKKAPPPQGRRPLRDRSGRA